MHLLYSGIDKFNFCVAGIGGHFMVPYSGSLEKGSSWSWQVDCGKRRENSTSSHYKGDYPEDAQGLQK